MSWEARPVRGVMVGGEGDVETEAWAGAETEEKTGDGGAAEVVTDEGHGPVTGIMGGL